MNLGSHAKYERSYFKGKVDNAIDETNHHLVNRQTTLNTE